MLSSASEHNVGDGHDELHSMIPKQAKTNTIYTQMANHPSERSLTDETMTILVVQQLPEVNVRCQNII